MCIAWQWPLWTIWTMTLPLMIYSGLWFGSLGTGAGILLYLAPTAVWAMLAAAVASLETKHTYADRITPAAFLRRCRRVLPYLVLNTGMLPHQFSSFAEGLFGGLHSEFERTPKAASVRTTSAGATARAGHPAALSTAPRPPATRLGVKTRWPYVSTEAFYVAYQLACTVLFISSGFFLCAAGSACIAMCVLFVAFNYGDNVGKVAFFFDKRSSPERPRTHESLDTAPGVLYPLSQLNSRPGRLCPGAG